MPETTLCGHEVYHSRVVSRKGKRGWQGGKNLAETAVYTWAFCRALLRCWEKRPDGVPQSDLEPEPLEADSDRPLVALENVRILLDDD